MAKSGYWLLLLLFVGIGALFVLNQNILAIGSNGAEPAPLTEDDLCRQCLQTANNPGSWRATCKSVITSSTVQDIDECCWITQTNQCQRIASNG